MLESVFVTLIVSDIVVFLIAAMRWDDDGDLAIWGLNFLISIVLMGSFIYVEVPWIAATNATQYTLGNQQHMEWSIFALMLGFIFLDAVVFILQLVSWRKEKNGIALP
jgi:hypothetical protein